MMGVREWANSHPKLASGVLGVFVLACVGWIVAGMLENRQPTPGKMPQRYYTTDDGKTFFALGGENVPPFTHEGKVAVRAYVFESNGKQFVGYLERYIPSARELKLVKKISPFQEMDGREMKRPGEATWMPTTDHTLASKMTRVAPPAGASEPPVPVEP